MIELHFGEIITKNSVRVECQLDGEIFVIWRDSEQFEAVICESENDVPHFWKLDQSTPWKIFGSQESIRRHFTVFAFPPGTKIIDLFQGTILEIYPEKGRIRYMGKRKKKIMIVDDSPTIRKILKHIVSTFSDWEVVAEVSDPENVPKALASSFPDLVSLDLNLGKLNGVDVMRKFLAPLRIPTLLITSQSMKDGSLVMEALSAGALDYLQKPESGQWDHMKEELQIKMEVALKAKWQSHCNPSPLKILNQKLDTENSLVVIGSSTGGTQALQSILTALPKEIPPILITQHIPEGFSKAFAERLNKICPFDIKEASDGDEIRSGRVLIAPGNHHMKISTSGLRVEVFAGEPINRFRPSIDVLFKSIAARRMKNVIGIILTGMGKDGAEGLLDLRKNGAFTIAQDESSCVVFGMPKEAIRIGAAIEIKKLNEIPGFLMTLLAKKTEKAKTI